MNWTEKRESKYPRRALHISSVATLLTDTDGHHAALPSGPCPSRSFSSPPVGWGFFSAMYRLQSVCVQCRFLDGIEHCFAGEIESSIDEYLLCVYHFSLYSCYIAGAEERKCPQKVVEISGWIIWTDSVSTVTSNRESHC